jgi:hypothetical protein
MTNNYLVANILIISLIYHLFSITYLPLGEAVEIVATNRCIF